MTTAPPEPLPLPARLTAPPRLTQRHPWLLPVAKVAHRTRRRTQWVRDGWSGRVVWAARRNVEDLPVRVKQHGSLLLRELAPDQMGLQHSKVTNLRLATGRLDGIVIGPGETFSFNRVVGNCTRRKGYVDGMRLANGLAEAGVGGGICQLANLVHWMVLHSPLTVVDCAPTCRPRTRTPSRRAASSSSAVATGSTAATRSGGASWTVARASRSARSW